MDRKELRTVVKAFYKSKGFQSQKKYMYKLIDDDYLVCAWLEPVGFMKADSLRCGGIYLPDENKWPLTGCCDVYRDFCFPKVPSEKLDFGNYNDYDFPKQGVTFYFEYEKYTTEQLCDFLNVNYDHFMVPMFDRNFRLDELRQDWRPLGSLGENSFMKMCLKAGLDPQEVRKHLGRQ